MNNNYTKTLLSLLTFLFFFTGAFAQKIRTIAGNGVGDSVSGNGGCAINATMGQIFSVAVDHHGNVYIADNYYNMIRKVTPDGTISRFAGLGYPYYTGDGGPASASALSAPFSLAFDVVGNLYVADAANLVIRRIDTSGNITTVAGNHYSAGYFNGDGIAAVGAKIGAPGGICLDNAGNLYIADANSRIRKVNTSGIITTVAGNGSVGYTGNGGPATNAALDGPIGVDVDNAGNIYIAEKSNNVVRKVNTSGIISVFAGSTGGFSGDGGMATAAKFNSLNAVRHDIYGNVYIADQNNQRIRKVDTTGHIYTVVGNPAFVTGVGYAADYYGDGGPATNARLANPSDICFDDYGNMFIADKGAGVATSVGHRIREVFKIDTMHLSVTPGDTICGTAHVVYTATEFVPHYCSAFVWRKNGVIVGYDAPTYVTDSVHDHDVITCTKIDTSHGGFVIAVSDTIRMVVKPVVVPDATVVSSIDSICEGQPITLNATPVNGGTSPTYDWYLFGVLIGSGSVLTYIPHVGDIVTCVMHSNAICAIPDTSHTQFRVNVNESNHPTIFLDPHPNDTIAFWGQIITLFTTRTLEGSAPTYQWYENDIAIPGATNSSYDEEIYYDVAIYCVMHSSAYCVVPDYDTSNVMHIWRGRLGLGVNNINDKNANFNLSPNPNTGSFAIKGTLPVNINSTHFIITDVLGKVVYDEEVPAQRGIMNHCIHLRDDLPNGMYLLNIKYDGGNSLVHFVIGK